LACGARWLCASSYKKYSKANGWRAGKQTWQAAKARLRQNPYKKNLTNPTAANARAGSVALMMSYE
jgi:hypothetical protein